MALFDFECFGVNLSNYWKTNFVVNSRN